MTDNGRGSIFKNDTRTKDAHAHCKGDCTIDGVKYWISAWLRDSKTGGSKYLSLAFRLADEQQPKVDARVSGFSEGEIPLRLIV
jgi:hypothetical protein